MLSDVDIYRAAHLMMHEYANNAEREAARCADRMLGRGDREDPTPVTVTKPFRRQPVKLWRGHHRLRCRDQ